MYAEKTIAEFCQQLSSADPTPGGGCASALAAMNGASLASMVAKLTASREKYAAVRPLMAEIDQEATASLAAFARDLDSDAKAFDAVSVAMKMPKTTDEEKASRKAAVQTALRGATEVPRGVALRCLDLLGYLPDLAREGNPNAASDVGVAGLLLYAALRGALLNVDINVSSLEDAAYAGDVRKEESRILEEGGRLAAEIEHEVRKRIG